MSGNLFGGSLFLFGFGRAYPIEHKKGVQNLDTFLTFVIIKKLYNKSYLGKLNALVISAICSSVIPSGVKPIDLAAT